MRPERCYPKLLLLLHSEATVLVDTALEADRRVAASAAKTADNLFTQCTNTPFVKLCKIITYKTDKFTLESHAQKTVTFLIF